MEINPQAGEYYDRLLDFITRKKQLINEATASNSASIDTDCGVRHTQGIQLPSHGDANRNQRCKQIVLRSLLFLAASSAAKHLKKNSSQHWDFEGSLEDEYVESHPVRKHRGARRRRPVQKRREKERRSNPPALVGWLRAWAARRSVVLRPYPSSREYVHTPMDTEYAAKLGSPT